MDYFFRDANDCLGYLFLFLCIMGTYVVPISKEFIRSKGSDSDGMLACWGKHRVLYAIHTDRHLLLFDVKSFYIFFLPWVLTNCGVVVEQSSIKAHLCQIEIYTQIEGEG